MNTKRKEELKMNPKYKAAYFRAAARWIEYRKARGLSCDRFMATPEKYFAWWLRDGGGLLCTENPYFPDKSFRD
jgi:hypothetical protein